MKHALNNPISPRGDPRARVFALVSRGSRQRAAEWFVGHVSTHFYLFLYLFRADPRPTHAHFPRGKPRLDCRDEIVPLPPRNLSGFRAFMGPLLGQLEDIARSTPRMLYDDSNRWVSRYVLLFLALVNGIFKRWCVKWSFDINLFGDENSFLLFRSTIRKDHEEFLYEG